MRCARHRRRSLYLRDQTQITRSEWTASFGPNVVVNSPQILAGIYQLFCIQHEILLDPAIWSEFRKNSDADPRTVELSTKSGVVPRIVPGPRWNQTRTPKCSDLNTKSCVKTKTVLVPPRISVRAHEKIRNHQQSRSEPTNSSESVTISETNPGRFTFSMWIQKATHKLCRALHQIRNYPANCYDFNTKSDDFLVVLHFYHQHRRHKSLSFALNKISERNLVLFRILHENRK